MLCIHDVHCFITIRPRRVGLQHQQQWYSSIIQQQRWDVIGPQSSYRLYAYASDESDQFDDDEYDELSDEELEATVGPWDEKIARFNTIQLTGRVGNTPEARYFDDGKVVVNLSLASRRKYHGMERKVENIKMGEEETDWYGLEIWVCTAVCRFNIISLILVNEYV
jgi:Single-strand binding protein family